MNKVISYGVAGLLLILTSCQEVGPFIDFGSEKPEDTTYTAAVEAAQPRKVLIEEFTGVTCPNCPQAHDIIKSLENQYPDRIISIGYYPADNAQTKPVVHHGYLLTKQDFRSPKAKQLGNDFFSGIPYLPVGTVDRIPHGSEIIYSRNDWSANTATRVNVPTKVNVSIVSAYNSTDRKAEVVVKTSFTKDITGAMALTMLLVENEIIDAQENNTLGVGAIDSFYEHNHVLREIYSFTTGTPFLDSLTTKTAGRVYERRFKLDIPVAWIAEKCKVIAFVHSADPQNKEVYQAGEVKLVP